MTGVSSDSSAGTRKKAISYLGRFSRQSVKLRAATVFIAQVAGFACMGPASVATPRAAVILTGTALLGVAALRKDKKKGSNKENLLLVSAYAAGGVCGFYVWAKINQIF